MTISVKAPVLITIFLLLQNKIKAQLKLPVTVTSQFATDIKTIIKDYPNNFHNLTGELLKEHPQSADYQCTAPVHGAKENFITLYSAKMEQYSWQALLLTTESFEKARQKFKSLYNQLNNLSADAGGAAPVRFRGKYEQPGEEKKFTSVIFSPDPATGQTAKLKMEISIQFHAPMEWQVRVMLYNREKEDEERGSIRE